VTTYTVHRRPSSQPGGIGPPRHRQYPPSAVAAAYGGGEDLDKLAILTADALESVVEAALSRDVAAARRVLRRSGARRSAGSLAEARVRQGLAQCPPRTGNLRAVASTLQLIADLGRVGDLVDILARQTAATTGPRRVPQLLRRDLMTVGGVGAHWVRQLAKGISGPAMDPGYLRAGCELRAVVDHLTGLEGNRGTALAAGPVMTATVCSALAEGVLTASRHAARAA
jgi:hypothetical protein